MWKKKNEIGSLVMSMFSAGNTKLADKGELLSLLEKELKKTEDNPLLKYGFRNESMFAYVAGALGHCLLIKQEDCAGICFSSEECINIPDYRIVLIDGAGFLAEVKNCNDMKIDFKESYVNGLQRYTSLNKLPLKIAIYWRPIRSWTLIPAEKLIFTEGKSVVTFDYAFAQSEMSSLLNDRMIATTPPLKIRLVADQGKTTKLDANNQCTFVIGDVQLFCAGNLIEDEIEKSIAFHLIQFGAWNETERVQESDGVVSYIEYEYLPEEKSEHGFDIIGSLSSIISRKFDDATICDEEVERVTPETEIRHFEIFIPENYKGNKLPLWQFCLQPNPDYKKATQTC